VLAATSIIIANKSASAASGVGGINAIPELAPQWKDLDLAEILSRPAAYMSVSQNKSLYDPGGVQAGEKHRERGSLPATVKVVTAYGELVGELRALVHPGDNEFNELALQTAFAGTQLPLELARKRIQTIVLTGIHLDWCIEGNARAARDAGYLPVVIGDACACQKPEQEAAAMERINNFFAPVISSERFVELLSRKA
jgi:hypothetical protein